MGGVVNYTERDELVSMIATLTDRLRECRQQRDKARAWAVFLESTQYRLVTERDDALAAADLAARDRDAALVARDLAAMGYVEVVEREAGDR